VSEQGNGIKGNGIKGTGINQARGVDDAWE
jgi:hypothetical protein